MPDRRKSLDDAFNVIFPEDEKEDMEYPVAEPEAEPEPEPKPEPEPERETEEESLADYSDRSVTGGYRRKNGIVMKKLQLSFPEPWIEQLYLAMLRDEHNPQRIARYIMEKMDLPYDEEEAARKAQERLRGE